MKIGRIVKNIPQRGGRRGDLPPGGWGIGRTTIIFVMAIDSIMSNDDLYQFSRKSVE